MGGRGDLWWPATQPVSARSWTLEPRVQPLWTAMAWKTAATVRQIGSTPLKNDGVRQIGSSQLLGEIKNCSKPPTRQQLLWGSFCTTINFDASLDVFQTHVYIFNGLRCPKQVATAAQTAIWKNIPKLGPEVGRPGLAALQHLADRMAHVNVNN